MISPWITSPAYPIHNKIIYIYPDIAILPYIHKIKKFYPKKVNHKFPIFSRPFFRDFSRCSQAIAPGEVQKDIGHQGRRKAQREGGAIPWRLPGTMPGRHKKGVLWGAKQRRIPLVYVYNIKYILYIYDVIIYYMILYVYLWTYWLIWNSIVSISIYHDFSPIDLLYVLEMYKWLLNRYNRYWGWGVKSYRALTASSVDSTSNNENWPDTKKWLWLIISFCRQNHLIFRWGRLLWRLWHGLVEVETCLVRRVSRFDHRQERGGSIGGLTGLPVMVR